MPRKQQPAKTVVIVYVTVKTEAKKPRPAYGECYRCGRTSHWKPDCYARMDIYGNKLDSDDYI